MTVYAVAESVPEGCGYLTAGTRYEVYEDDIGFFANDDKGRRFYSLWDETNHLDGGHWTRIDEPTPSQTASQDRAVEAVAGLIEMIDAACSNHEQALNFLAQAGRPGLADTLRCFPANIRDKAAEAMQERDVSDDQMTDSELMHDACLRFLAEEEDHPREVAAGALANFVRWHRVQERSTALGHAAKAAEEAADALNATAQQLRKLGDGGDAVMAIMQYHGACAALQAIKALG